MTAPAQAIRAEPSSEHEPSPPSPPARARAARATFGERLAGLLIALGLLAVLIAAASVEPARQGFGTHTRLGLPQCGWVVAFNKPCFTCGMTTAFAHAVRLQFISAFLAQPMGLLAALLTAAGLWPALHVALTGSRLGPTIARLITGRVLIVLGVLTLVAWGYKLATWPAAPSGRPSPTPTTTLPPSKAASGVPTP